MDLEVIALKGYSIFPKVPELEPDHHIQDTRREWMSYLTAEVKSEYSTAPTDKANRLPNSSQEFIALCNVINFLLSCWLQLFSYIHPTKPFYISFICLLSTYGYRTRLSDGKSLQIFNPFLITIEEASRKLSVSNFRFIHSPCNNFKSITFLFVIQGFRTIVLIFIVIFKTFRPICFLVFFRCFLSNSGAYKELETTFFI